nr:MAG TPA: hypothetical protein [Caudoviricetes sp.]
MPPCCTPRSGAGPSPRSARTPRSPRAASARAATDCM